ncbi:unnamed protein product, partial [Rotaria magnacalcarata]
MDIAMHYFTIEMQCMQLHDNTTYFMHYNALTSQKIVNYNALIHFFFEIMENNGSFFHYAFIIGYMGSNEQA